MWGVLSDLGFAENYREFGDRFAPMQRLAAALSRRPYADQLNAFTSLATLVITTEPSRDELHDRDRVSIQFFEDTRLFDVQYAEWVQPKRNPPHRVVSHRKCSEEEALSVVDLYVLRLLIARRLP